MKKLSLLLLIALFNCSAFACKKPFYGRQNAIDKEIDDFYDSLLEEDEKPENFATQCEEKKYGSKTTKYNDLTNKKHVLKEEKKTSSLSATTQNRLAMLFNHINGQKEQKN